jgi:hypothetical protein
MSLRLGDALLRFAIEGRGGPTLSGLLELGERALPIAIIRDGRSAKPQVDRTRQELSEER